MKFNESCTMCKMHEAVKILNSNRECIECLNNEVPGLGDMLNQILIKFGKLGGK